MDRLLTDHLSMDCLIHEVNGLSVNGLSVAGLSVDGLRWYHKIHVPNNHKIHIPNNHKIHIPNYHKIQICTKLPQNTYTKYTKNIPNRHYVSIQTLTIPSLPKYILIGIFGIKPYQSGNPGTDKRVVVKSGSDC
jgi:hypothetical protein